MLREYCLELNQANVLVETLLQSIVTSRRLLADHVETLELADIDSGWNNSRGRKIIATSAVGFLGVTAASVHFLQPRCNALKWASTAAASAYAVIWTIKTAQRLKNRWIVRRMQRILDVLNEIDSGIKRTIAYSREIKVLKREGTSDLYADKLARQCIQSIVDISKLIFTVTKTLEATTLPPHIAELYQPLDDLEGCTYFERDINEFTTNDFKDFYNVFLFFQSQLLTHLCLSIAYNRNVAIAFIKTELPRLHSALAHHSQSILEPLSIQSNKSRQKNLLRKPMNCLPLNNLKSESLEITSRLLAIAKECSRTDATIQGVTNDMVQKPNQRLEDIFTGIKQIETSLVSCMADFQRLVLASHKVLLIAGQQPGSDDNDADTEENATAIEGSDTKPKVSEEQPVENTDYFAFRDPANEESPPTSDNETALDGQSRKNVDDEIEQIDRKIVKKHFAPVLKQLKTKINPIQDEMRERERKYFTSIGVDTKRLDDIDAEKSSTDGSDSDSDGSEMEARIRARSKYDEMRSFLGEKQQISFLPSLPSPDVNRADEDILE